MKNLVFCSKSLKNLALHKNLETLFVFSYSKSSGNLSLERLVQLPITLDWLVIGFDPCRHFNLEKTFFFGGRAFWNLAVNESVLFPIKVYPLEMFTRGSMFWRFHVAWATPLGDVHVDGMVKLYDLRSIQMHCIDYDSRGPKSGWFGLVSITFWWEKSRHNKWWEIIWL